jgi:cytochrome c
MRLLGIAAVACAAGFVFSGTLAPPARAQQPADAVAGEALFKQRCASCHAIGGKGGKIGPDLTRIIGRKAGSAAYSYSAAMKGSRIIWSAKTLDAFLGAPTKTVPGTKMAIAVSKPDDRAAIVSYLARSR